MLFLEAAAETRTDAAVIRRARFSGLVRMAMAIVGCTLGQAATAQSALIIEPAKDGSLSDPTIQPYLSSGGGSPFSASIAVPRAGGLPDDIFACHMNSTMGPNGARAQVPCRMLRMQADGSMIDISRQVFGSGPLPSLTQATTKFVVGDFNEDGRADIFVPVLGYDGVIPGVPPGEMNILLISNADGTYTDRSSTLPQVIEGTPTVNGNHVLLVGIFAGAYGVDRFMLGQTGLGVLKLLTLGGCGVWHMIDLILVATGNLRDSRGNSLRWE